MSTATWLRPGGRPRAALALAAAAAGEALVRTGRPWGVGAALYVLAALLLAPAAWPRTEPREAPRAAPARGSGVLAAGAALALLLGAASVFAFFRRDPGATLRFWIASAVVLAAASLLAGRRLDVPERWGVARLPSSRSARVLVALGLAALLGVAAFLRLWNLAKIPWGVNPDEGDQAALAIQIARGFDARGPFGFGWYHISMVYYKLLAAVMSVAGLDVAGARVFGALCGLATVALVVVVGVRHFGWRAGVLAGVLVASMGGALQFSRVTTVAAPTATLWALSAAAFLEAARNGRAFFWALAGLAGGFSIFFYPTGRLWCVLAVPFALAVFLVAERGTRGRVAAGVAVAALASAVAAGPFLAAMVRTPEEFTLRARETTVFLPENAARLQYVDPAWSLPHLMAAQLEHALGFFNRYVDQNILWPTDRPLFGPAFALLALLGVLAATLRVRDLRLLLLALWFWVGYAGVIVTVETPNMHRSATAIPVLPLLAALVLDECARRYEGASGSRARGVATGAAAVLALFCAGAELVYYFGPYAARDGWPFKRTEGMTVAREGESGWAVTLGCDAHMVNSGWVGILAPRAHRLGVTSPGIQLPLALPANRGISFLVYGRQAYYVPYLESMYPGGTLFEERHPPNELVMLGYRVPLSVWGARRGALASTPLSAPVRVDTVGERPASLPRAGEVRWAAALRVPHWGNASFRIADGVLAIDGHEVLRTRGRPSETTVALAEGDHDLVLTSAAAGGTTFLWKPPGGGAFRPALPSELWAGDGAPRGLLGTYQKEGLPREMRLDATLASMSLTDDVGFDEGWTATWRGTLVAPADGPYAFGFMTFGGTIELTLDRETVLRTEGDDERWMRFPKVALRRGPHAVTIVYRVEHRPAAVEWFWTPPGGVESLVPPDVLRPPPDAGPRPPLDAQEDARLAGRTRRPSFIFAP